MAKTKTTAKTNMKTTVGELADLLQAHFNVQDVKGKDFAIVIANNIDVLTEVLQPLEEISRPSEEFMKFANEMQKHQQTKNDDAIKQLQEANAELIIERQHQMDKDKVELAKDAKEVELLTINNLIMPIDMTARQITGLSSVMA